MDLRNEKEQDFSLSYYYYYTLYFLFTFILVLRFRRLSSLQPQSLIFLPHLLPFLSSKKTRDESF